jgi:hypothetical protein
LSLFGISLPLLEEKIKGIISSHDEKPVINA